MPRGGKRPGAGRPKGSRNVATKDSITDLAAEARKASKTALDALIQIAKSGESESARVSAANAILDRAFGKPLTSVELTGKHGGPIQTMTLNPSALSDAALAELYAAMAGQEDDGAAQVH